MLPETKSSMAVFAAERVRLAIEDTPLEISDKKIAITVSIGIAGFPENGTEIEEIMHKADKALYRSKQNGKNRVTVISDK